MTGFATAWALHHRGEAPIGFELRDAGAPNWVRFHSLPNSKRYPDTDEERAGLLERQNRLALEVLGDRPCWVAQSHWPQPTPGDERRALGATRDLALDYAFSFMPRTMDGDAWIAHAKLTTWPASATDDLLLSIADDRAAPIIWMSAANGAVFAPYDGGVDLFLATADETNRLRATYPDWLSAHPEGL